MTKILKIEQSYSNFLKKHKILKTLNDNLYGILFGMAFVFVGQGIGATIGDINKLTAFGMRAMGLLGLFALFIAYQGMILPKDNNNDKQ